MLRHDDQAGFERYLHDVYDPGSPRFRHYLKQSEIADRFGPSRADYDALLRYMGAHGFTLTQGSKNRLTMTMRGTRADAEGAFDIKIRDYRIGERNFHANDRDPSLPLDLVGHVQAIAGISDLARPHHTVAAIVLTLGLLCWAEIGLPGYNAALCPVAICYSAFEAGAAAACPACNIPVVDTSSLANVCRKTSPPPSSARQLFPQSTSAELSGAETVGAGQTIGLVEFDNFHSSDVSNYLSLIGAPSSEISNLSEVNVNGGVAVGPDEDEVLLDIDAELTLAPGANVVVYDAPFGGAEASFQPVLNKMVSDGVTIISNSWAYCEDETTAADVDSIDMINQQAAAAGISVFNGSGDDGSTCLDGSPNVVGVPADSPNATAVGGTSLTVGAGDSYQSETWWNGLSSSPPTGQGGFGVSQFFATPSYQTGLAASRSVPDVVDNADPAHGVVLCQADAGGCPDGKFYAGTSIAAPVWAAFAAQLNQEAGKNLGFLNPLIYPLANSGAFHDAVSLGSDFGHVGLGSPNLDALGLALTGQSAGAVSASGSIVAPLAQASLLLSPFEQSSATTFIPADGSTQSFILVQLLDGNGHIVGGKTVTLKASSSNAEISPSGGTNSSTSNGIAQFTVTDSTAETVMFTAMDTTDGVTVTQQASVKFGVPPATSAGIVASLNSEPADGMTADTITVTLKDSLGRPTPGKTVTLAQGDTNSVITAPIPSVTDSSGEIKFSVTDLHTETVDYTATDLSDGNLAVPGDAAVDFTSGGGGCASASYVTGTADAAAGYQVSAFATGFAVNSGDQGFSYNCFGAYGMAWDASGNMYVTDWPTGNIYKFGSSGGVANASHLFTTIQAPATGVAIDPAGNMFASEGSVSGPNGAIVPVDLSTGTVGTAIASGIECLGSMTLNPSIPALFAIDFCNLDTGGSNNIWEVTGIDGASPTTSVYAQVPASDVENLLIVTAPDGTLYDVFGAAAGGEIARVATDGTVTTLTAADGSPIFLYGGLGIALGGMQASGDAQFLIAPFNSEATNASGLGEGVWTLDLTGAAPALAVQLTATGFSGLSNFAIGPDGCLYVAGGPTVSRVTNADGSCTFGPTTQPPAISLTPAVATPNPAQGSSQSFTAALHYTSALTGVPVTLTATGANLQTLLANTNASGTASFSYAGTHQGTDNLVAFASISGASVASNPAQVTWDAGQDLTFLTLAKSPAASDKIQTVTLSANLSDVSVSPFVPVAGQTISFSVGDQGCMGTTNASGDASCEVTPTVIGMGTLSATFAGTADLASASASEGFMGIPPVPGKLKISPKALNFGSVAVGDSKTKTLKITNAGKVSKKKNAKVALPITVVMQSVNNSVYQVKTECVDTLDPKAKGMKAGTCTVTVEFTPTEVTKYPATLTVSDNLEPNLMQAVPVKGAGKK